MGLTTYGIDNAAHIGGLGAGYLYGYKFMAPNEVQIPWSILGVLNKLL